MEADRGDHANSRLNSKGFAVEVGVLGDLEGVDRGSELRCAAAGTFSRVHTIQEDRRIASVLILCWFLCLW